MIWFLIIWQIVCMAILFTHNRGANWARLLIALCLAGVLVPWHFVAAFVDTWRRR